MFKKCLSILLCFILLCQLFPGAVYEAETASAYSQAHWEQLIKSYKDSLLGGDNVDWTDTEIQNIVSQTTSAGLTSSGIAYKGGKYWLDLESNRGNPNRVFGTADIDIDKVTSDTMRRQFVSLHDMARAYGTPGTVYVYKDGDGNQNTLELYQNPLLRDAIFYGLEKSTVFYTYDNMIRQKTGANAASNYNWWDWSFGAPQMILETLLVLHPFVTAEEQTVCDTMTTTCLRIIDKLRPNVDKSSEAQTVANRRTRLNNCAMIAALTGDAELMEQTRTNLEFFLEPNYGKGDGVKVDGSYICHDYYPLEGTYGTEVLGNRIIHCYSVFTGTAFQLNSANRSNQFGWIMEVFRPILHNGVMMVQNCGRYPNYGGKMYGCDAIKAALKLIGCFGEAEDLQLKQFIRAMLLADTESESRKIYSTFATDLDDVNLVSLLKTILFEETIPEDDRQYAVMRYTTDRATQHRENYTVGLAMSSNRVPTHESCNGCNRYGWYTGDGVVYVYNDTTSYLYDQYGEQFQRYANMYRLPGTTEEDSTLREPWSHRAPYFPGKTYTATSSKQEWVQDYYADGTEAASFVGGVEMDNAYLAAAMDFEAYSWTEEEAAYEATYRPKDALFNQRNQVLVSDLTAKKSYFLFDDEIVCIGSDIDFTTRDTEINTYVDNRGLLEKTTENGKTIYGTEDILVDGIMLEKVTSFDAPMAFTDPTWVHQENFGGYYFPKGGQVYINKTMRKASNDGDDTNDDYNQVSLTTTPLYSGTYSFFELWISHGRKPVNGTYSYIMLPEKTVEETQSYTENPDIKVLKCTTDLHVVQETSLGITAMVFWKAGTYGGITVDRPMILMVREQNGKYSISISDPTQNLTAGTVAIDRELYATSLDTEITVSGREQTVLHIDFSACGGKTVSAEFYTEVPTGLMFDFHDSADHMDPTYGYLDYTKESVWATVNTGGNTVSVSKGMMTIPLVPTVTDPTKSGIWTGLEPSDSQGNFALSTNPAKANFLHYAPRLADVIQIRVKFVGVASSGISTPNIALYYLPEGGEVWNNSTSSPYFEKLKLTVDEKYLTGGSAEGQFVTLTLSLTGSKFLTCDYIQGIRLDFNHLLGGNAVIDYIYIGPKTESLYFGFDGDGGAVRYGEGAYGGYDYDAAEGANWATNLTAQAGRLFTVDREKGTLSLYTGTDYNGTSEASGDYGAYLETSAVSGSYPWSYPERHALSYDPEGAEILEVRFKTEAMVGVEGKIPQLVIHYAEETGGVLTRHNAPCRTFTLQNGSYQTVRVPLDETFTQSDLIKSLGIRFRFVRGGGNGSLGKITVDYIFVGKAVDAPSNLYIGFSDTKADRERYASQVYSNINFDQGGFSYSSARLSAPVISAQEGTLTISSVPKAATGPLYLQTSPNLQKNLPLNYHPQDAEYIQLRFKLENYISSGTAKVGLYYYGREYSHSGGADTIANIAAAYSIPTDALTSGEYLTVTLPVSESFRNREEVTAIRLNFSGIVSADDTNPGKITVDYIYVGQAEDLPVRQHLVTFTDGNGGILGTDLVSHGGTASYKGVEPTKESDSSFHYSFQGWDRELTNITSDSVMTAQFAATAHRYTYVGLDEEEHVANCTCGYSKSDTHSYSDGRCVCGQDEVKEPVQNATWKIGHTLNLASDISINLAVSKSLLSGFDMDTVYIMAEIDLYTGNEKTGTKTVKILPVEQGNYYYFTLTGLTAVNMNDRIRSVLYGTKDGQEYYSETDDYSIADYAYSQMNKTAGVPDKLKILCAELLRYGGAAQIYKNYRVNELADSKMTDVHKAYLSDVDAVVFGNTNKTLDDLAGAPIKWAGKSLNLDSKVCLKFIFSKGTFTGNVSDLSLRVSYTDTYGANKDVVLTGAELYNEKLGYYAFTLDTMLAAELRSVVSVQVYSGNTPVSCTLQYSADTYGNNKTGTLLDVCKALFAYCDSAKSYFNG